MNILLCLGYGIAIFLALVAASIPYGFILGFCEARGNPLQNPTISWLKLAEHVTEIAVLIFLTSHIFTSAKPAPTFVAFGAYILANTLAYVIDVRYMGEPIKTFYFRTVVAFVVCLPAGYYFSSAAQGPL